MIDIVTGCIGVLILTVGLVSISLYRVFHPKPVPEISEYEKHRQAFIASGSEGDFNKMISYTEWEE